MNHNKLATFLEKESIQKVIIWLIVFNSATIGMETSETIMNSYGSLLLTIDKIILALFVVELLLKIYAYRSNFFRNGWNIFDFSIVLFALMPASGSLTVLRSLRIFRSLRLIKNVPKLRLIVESLFHTLPSLLWIFVLLSLIFYVFSVIGTKLFGNDFPVWFGNLGSSMYTLFQIMTLEGWVEISSTIMDKYPLAYIYFIIFILLASYTTLNIFIAIVVNTMSDVQKKTADEGVEKIEHMIQDKNEELKKDLNILKEQIVKMEQKLFNKN